MERNPDAIENDINATRERIGDTVEAIGYKADVPARAKEAVAKRFDAVKGAVAGGVQRATAGARSATANASHALESARASAGDATAYAKQLPSMAANNPLGLAIGAVAVGFLIGLLVPVSDVERDRVGQIGETLLENAQDAAGSVIDQGKVAAMDTLATVTRANENQADQRTTSEESPSAD